MRLSDLASKQHADTGLEGVGSNVWYATIVAPAPLTGAGALYVVIPDIALDTKFGPCKWRLSSPTATLPQVGNSALVIFDNRQQPWVVSWV